MVKEKSVKILGGLLAVVIASFLYGVGVSAERFTSPSYTIDASIIGNSFGGDASSASYKLTSSGGESIIGQGSGGSYKLDSGYVTQLTDSSSSFSLAVQPSGLIGYYSFDNVSSGQTTVANDAGVTSRPLNVIGTTLASTTGKVGNAADYNGTFYYHDNQTGGAGYYDIAPGGKMTNMGWFKTSGTLQSLVWNHYNCIGWAVHVAANGYLQAYYTGGTGCGNILGDVSLYSDSTVNNNAWHHFAVTYDRTAGVISLYIDGSLHDTSSSLEKTGQTATPAPLRLGARVDGGNKLSGQLDEIKSYNRVLSESEIKAEYSAQNVGTPSGLSFGTVVPNTANTALFDSIVQTSATSYSLAIHQNNDLTATGGNTIPAITPTIDSPQAWVDSTTKGLGFTLTSTNATAIDGKWSSGTAYARIPTSTASTFYNRTGTPATKDVITSRLRADVTAAQPIGQYNNVVTVTGTFSP